MAKKATSKKKATRRKSAGRAKARPRKKPPPPPELTDGQFLQALALYVRGNEAPAIAAELGVEVGLVQDAIDAYLEHERNHYDAQRAEQRFDLLLRDWLRGIAYSIDLLHKASNHYDELPKNGQRVNAIDLRGMHGTFLDKGISLCREHRAVRRQLAEIRGDLLPDPNAAREPIPVEISDSSTYRNEHGDAPQGADDAEPDADD